MRCRKGILAGAILALLPLLAGTAANAQKQGGTLRIFHRDSPANMSIDEEGTISVVAPMMPIFNNLVLFNQHEKQNRIDNIVPDLAESWSWSEDGRDLTFKLHQGVNWHDGKRFTPPTSSALGTCCRARRKKRCASMPARHGGPILTMSLSITTIR